MNNEKPFKIENPEETSEILSPKEINDAIGYFQNYMTEAHSLGGNDTEMPTAKRFIDELMTVRKITKERLEEMEKELGKLDDKSSNYH